MPYSISRGRRPLLNHLTEKRFNELIVCVWQAKNVSILGEEPILFGGLFIAKMSILYSADRPHTVRLRRHGNRHLK